MSESKAFILSDGTTEIKMQKEKEDDPGEKSPRSTSLGSRDSDRMNQQSIQRSSLVLSSNAINQTRKQSKRTYLLLLLPLLAVISLLYNAYSMTLSTSYNSFTSLTPLLNLNSQYNPFGTNEEEEETTNQNNNIDDDINNDNDDNSDKGTDVDIGKLTVNQEDKSSDGLDSEIFLSNLTKLHCKHPKIIATACHLSASGIATSFCMLKKIPYVLGNNRLTVEIRVINDGEFEKYEDVEETELRDPCIQHIILNSDRKAECKNITIFKKTAMLRKLFMRDGGSFEMPSSLANQQLAGVFWNPDAKLVMLRNPEYSFNEVVNRAPASTFEKYVSRPLSLHLLSEVMSQIESPSSFPNDDVSLFRAYGSRSLIPNSLGIHYIQGFTHSCTDRAPKTMITAGLWDKNMTDDDFRKILASKKSLAMLSASSVMKSSHLPDAVLRWVMCALLKKYKACDVVTKNKSMPMVSWQNLPGKKNCPGSDLDSWVCFQPFKFALAMENTQIDGYLSEKAIMAGMAKTIPVYFGNRDYFKFLNPRRVVFCHVSDTTIAKIRSFKKNKKLQIPFVSATEIGMPFLDNGYNETNYPGTSDLFNKIRWGVKELEEELKHCVEEIKYLDQHDDAYIEKLKEPFYIDNKIEDTAFDGTYSARATVNILKFLKSPLIWNLDAETVPGIHPDELPRRVHHDDLKIENAIKETRK